MTIAWHCTTRTPTTTSTDTHMSVVRIVSLFKVLSDITRTRTVAQVLSLSQHPHGHLHVSVSFRLDSPSLFFCTSSRPLSSSSKFVVSLHTPPNESMNSTDEFSLSTGYEPKAYDFNETSVEPYMQLLDSPPLFSDKVSSADPDYDDATLEDVLHRAQSASPSLSTRRLVCQSVVVVNVR